MNLLKSHFWHTKSQRNGIFFLIVLILLLEGFIVFGDFSSNEIIEPPSTELVAFHNQIDSLQKVEIERRKPKIYPFNPNYITDYKGGQLGMSLSEIDRLLVFREKNKFINSKQEFQQVTKVSDSLLNTIAPYFKFPDWVVKRNEKLQKENSSLLSTTKQESIQNIPKENTSTIDINKASILDLQSINGIGDALSERIIKYRTKLQGFSFDDQLYEVWGLDRQLADKVLLHFKIIKKPVLKKLNINTIEFKELLNNPYVDYNLCVKIFNYRDEVAELQDISELKNISGFPLDKYDRIVLYLMSE